MNASVYHRTDSFYKDLLQCREMLAPLFGSKALPLILSSSGTGALEAGLTNLTSEGDEVLVVDGGKFGNRWKQLAETYGLKVHSINLEWGTTLDPKQIEASLKDNPGIKAVFFQANETSTGVHYDVEKIATSIKANSNALIIVDAVSSIGAHKMKMDEWGLDCVVSGSQKGFGIPPGLAFICLSDRAWNSISGRPKYYFDLEKEKKNQVKGSTSWTPAITLVASLKVTLELMHEAGLDNIFAHHARAATAVRAGVKAMGLELLTSRDHSDAVTAIRIPDGLDGAKLVAHLREAYSAIFAGGQDHMKGKIIRFGHLGFFDRLDLISGMGALEMALKDLGFNFNLGSGTSAVLEHMRENK
jgi:aspartate aminotransferase-like enzyme